MQCIIGSPRQKLKPQASLIDEIEAKLNQIKDLSLGNLRSQGLPRNAEELYAFEESLRALDRDRWIILSKNDDSGNHE